MRSVTLVHPWRRSFILSLALVGLLAPGCPAENGTVTEPPNGDDPPVETAERRLAIVGPTLVQIEAGGEATLRVALAEDEVGAVANEVVEFAVVGDSAGSTLGGAFSATTMTDANGMAAVTLAAGSEETIFQVTAASPGATQVAFAIHVVKLQHRIAIVRTPNVRVATSGTEAVVESGAYSRVLLRVRITDQFGRPVPDAQVTYSFPQSPRSASFDNAGAPVVTNPGGEAQIALDTGTDLDDTFVVAGRTEESAQARWNVRLQTDESRICITDDDCGPGLYCRSGTCQGSAACSNEEPVVECPIGYRCVVNECHPAFNIGCNDDDDCGTGFICIDGSCHAENPQCEENADCPLGFECQNGICVGDPNGELPNISGGWYTAHHFNVREALPSVLGSAAGPLRQIHRILLGEIDLPWYLEWAEGLLADLIAQYIPPWVTTVISILDTLLTVMSDLRARGYMAVTQTESSYMATEVWDSFVFYYLPMCSGPPPANPTPDCARVDLFVDDMTDNFSLGLKVYPFSGTVGEIGPDTTAIMLVDTRKVDINISRLIRWVVDELVGMLTSYDDLESAVLASVDCRALGQSAANLVGVPSIAGLVETACNAGLRIVLDQVLDYITGVAFDLGMLEFAGQSTVNDIRAGNYANLLGYPDFETSRDGTWDGQFTRVVKGVPGAWHGSRRTLP